MLYEKSLNPLFIDIIRLSHSQASGKTLLRDICLQMLLKMRMARIKSACPQMLSVPRGAVPSWLSLFPKEIGRDQEAIVFQNDNLYVVIRTDFPKKNGHPGIVDRFRGYRQKTAGPGLRKSALMSLC